MKEHLYGGDCPDASQPNSRDQDCEACREQDALRKDAERYRYLRGLSLSEKALAALCALTGEKMDAAIDADIAAMNGANA